MNREKQSDETTFIAQNRVYIESTQQDDPKSKPTLKQKLVSIINSRIFQGITILIIFAIITPTLVYYFYSDLQDLAGKSSSTCLVQPGFMVPCGNNITTRTTCSNLRCCFDDDTNLCYHYFPAHYRYKLQDTSFKPTELTTPFGNPSLPTLRISVVEINKNQLQIILHDGEEIATQSIPDKTYYYKENYEYFLNVEVFRSTGETILSTAKGPLIASNGYWEWTFHMGSDEIFGLGELRLTNRTTTKVIYKNKDDHNTLPIFMGFKKGIFHGVAVEHEGPLEISVLPSQLVILRSLAGSKIVLNVVTGGTPDDVAMQLRKFEYKAPPDWVLGPHICSKDGTDLPEAIAMYKKRVADTSGIRYASDCFHENLMSMLLTASPKEIGDIAVVIKELRERGKFVLSLPPQIPIGDYSLYNSAAQKGLLYKKDEVIWAGQYFGQKTAYVDYSAENINEWIVELFGEINKLGNQLPDGIALIDNWPAEESYTMSRQTNTFPYLSQDLLQAMSNTTPWDATNSKSTVHLLLHNNYGTHQLAAITAHNPDLVVMTSSYQYGVQNPALIQNEQISWGNLKKMMTTNLYHSIFGGPLVASSVCGSKFYSEITQEDMCIRWNLIAATMPIFKTVKDWSLDGDEIHTNFMREHAERALKRREELSYYSYGYILEGKPIVTPMFYKYFADTKTFPLDEQYMLGDDLLVAQPTRPNLSKLRLYLPETSGGWFEYWDGEFYEEDGWTMVDVIDTDWVMFVRAGAIVPTKTLGGISLTAALDCENNCTASGNLRIGTSTLSLSGTEEVIRLENVNEIQNIIGCGTVGNVPMVIENVRIYKSHGGVKIKPHIDLCANTADYIDIAVEKI